MKKNLWAGLAALVAIAASAPSHASTVSFQFKGPGIFGALALTIQPASNQGSLPSTPANAFNPIGSYSIIGVTGTFTDTKANIVNAQVFGPEGLNQVAPESSNLYAPADFSLLKVKSGVPAGPGQTSPGLHYDNLYYPGGSPQTASDYTAHGGAFDIYGLAFTLKDGTAVNLWSNGDGPGGADYGVAVTDRITLLDYTSGGVSAVPLPGTAPLFGAALLALGAIGYGLSRRTVAEA